jgi:D-alanyl-D-alanine dipeptidase
LVLNIETVPEVLISQDIPSLLPEQDALHHVPASIPTAGGELLCEMGGPGIVVLHSYARAGWRHSVERQWLRAEALQRLQSVAKSLPTGFGLAIFDGWRPLDLQQELFDALGKELESGVAVAPAASDPAAPPPHLTGGAVDLTLTWQGEPVALGTQFDEFTSATPLKAFEKAPGRVRDLRRLLYHSLRDCGYVALAEEWWHFEYGTRLWSVITCEPVRYGPAKP